ncbi:DMT family transporter [Kibdelosporangium philippinense]|uniref:DMT family transporter n=1 Tax=Kibdelosporangium philippinense TaxID=211113 RepID=A0ABS8ZMB1_9PSEU|nr:DMT family transporter [Kibdelosporangium philippinense]MCE7008899.1 DMT family transporter [Kibdelosporangium philippinense]
MRTYLMLVLVMALWGSAFASSKLGVNEVPPQVAAFFRFGFGAVVLLALHSTRRGIPRKDLGKIAGLGMLGMFGYNSFFFLALSLAPSADGSVIVPVTAPVITVAVTALLGRRKLTVRSFTGLAIAVAGATVFFVGIPGGGSARLVGDLLFLGAAACWAAYTMLGAPLLSRLPAFTVTTFATTAGALALGVVALPFFGDVQWSTLGAEFWLNQAYLAILPTALAYVMYYEAVRTVGPATASSAMFLVPVFGLLGAWAVLDESITPVQAIGAAGMLVGAFLATIVKTPKLVPVGSPR